MIRNVFGKDKWATLLQVHVLEKETSDLRKRQKVVRTTFDENHRMMRSCKCAPLQLCQNCVSHLQAMSSMQKHGPTLDTELDLLERDIALTVSEVEKGTRKQKMTTIPSKGCSPTSCLGRLTAVHDRKYQVSVTKSVSKALEKISIVDKGLEEIEICMAI